MDTAHDIYELTKVLDQIYNATYLNNQNFRQDAYRKSHEQRKFQKLEVNDKVFLKLSPTFNKETKSPFLVQEIIPTAFIQIKSIKDTHLSPMFVVTNNLLPLEKRKQQLRSTPEIDRPSTSHQTSI